MTEPKIYFLEDREEEICMFGDFVGITWELNEVTQRTIDDSGQRRKTITFERTGDYSIGFPIIRGSEGDYYLSDEKSIAGGLTLEEAQQVARELTVAVEYLESIEIAKGK